MRFIVEIPDWKNGRPIQIAIDAKHMDEAEHKIVHWVNRQKGFRFCKRPPEGTKIMSVYGSVLRTIRDQTPSMFEVLDATPSN